MAAFRRFELHRDQDVSGISGTGVVADGVEFPDPFTVEFPDGVREELPAGWVRLTWRGELSSTVLWASADVAEKVHGHNGATRLVWADT